MRLQNHQRGDLPEGFTFICRHCSESLSRLTTGLRFSVRINNMVLGLFDTTSQHLPIYVPFTMDGYPGVVFCRAHCPTCNASIARFSIPSRNFYRNNELEGVSATITECAASGSAQNFLRILLLVEEYYLIRINITPAGQFDNQIG